MESKNMNPRAPSQILKELEHINEHVYIAEKMVVNTPKELNVAVDKRRFEDRKKVLLVELKESLIEYGIMDVLKD